MIRIITTIFLLLAAHSGESAVFSETQVIMELQKSIDNRATKIIQRFDSQAIAFSRVKLARKESNLPSVPFSVERVQLGDDGQPRISSLAIKIVGDESLFDENAKTAIKDIIKDSVGVTPVLTFTVVTANDTRGPAETNSTSQPKTFIAGLKSQLYSNPTGILGAFAIVCLFLAFTFLSLFRFSTERKLHRELMGQISSAADNIALSSGGGPTTDPARQEEAPQIGAGANTNIDAMVKELPISGLLAVLSDCYWSELDEFGAYLWRRLPIARRQQVLNEMPILRNWVTQLGSKIEVYLGHEQDPYYLDPLPISHINNDEVTKLVKKTPGLYSSLPKMRRDGASLSVEERINLHKIGSDIKDYDAKKLAEISPSMPRKFKNKAKIQVSNVQDEEALLTLDGLTLEQKRNIPTLVWAKDLNQEDLTEVLRPYNAQMLASALVGPDSIVQKLLEAVPEKKRKLVTSYQRSIIVDRQSTTYHKICAAIVDRLPVSEIPEERSGDENVQVSA